ncbi:serine hydroxymethyltransferase [Mycolicibacterium murale]|uniref:Serine hydroxymethyltransferase n=1 Tax=Mycolicibacterium murale TaxID=182220 RepID=A0A7I9WMB4_9MYCO|nr:DegT/DnrJ/EryC1/StrS family aminotransferase [Mycolicibacterium murale]MCV7185916.1 DegT/DnrJ/EryC1/StrS family aminotransferase [Mycolicibacterium murale]GFG58783.1 serine hydroxymethyltransferase [Mycolicibacterium murale]
MTIYGPTKYASTRSSAPDGTPGADAAASAQSRASIAPWASTKVLHRLAELEQRLSDMPIAHLDNVVRQAHRDHSARVRGGFMLYAGTNVTSPRTQGVHDAAISTRPALGWPGEKDQTAVEEIEHLEVLAHMQVTRAMRARYAEIRFVTATMANLAAYVAFTRPGDTIAVLSPEAGGHSSHQQLGGGAASVRGLEVVHLPYSPSRLDVDTAALPSFVDRTRPRMIVVGGSVALFPHNLEPVRRAADRVGAVLMYDASHTAGLMAAGLFQDPLNEGADIVTFSTYKTFGGPPGGAAITNNPSYAERLSTAAYPTLSANYDASRLGPLAVAAAEAVDQKPAWAGPMIQCAKEFGARLHAGGLPVVGANQGFTRSHQVIVKADRIGGACAAVRRLEGAGLFAGTCRLPSQRSDAPPAGIRFGLQEFVRSGGGLSTVGDLADLVREALVSGDVTPIRTRTADLRAEIDTDLWGRRNHAVDPEAVIPQ